MEEKNQTNRFRKERFEFVLSVNNSHIVCQRYFKMDDFKRESRSSIELVEAVDKCVELIERDLKDKTYVYLNCVSPQFFDTVEQLEKYSRVYNTKTPVIACVKENGKNYVVCGHEFHEYANSLSVPELSTVSDKGPFYLKFSVLEYGKEFCSKVFDISQYPRAIRTNIDLSNSRARYRGKFDMNDATQLFEYLVSCQVVDGREDLIPKIIGIITEACSYEEVEDYTRSDVYDNDGQSEGKNYNFNLWSQNLKYLKTLEDKDKTAKYFGHA